MADVRGDVTEDSEGMIRMGNKNARDGSERMGGFFPKAFRQLLGRSNICSVSRLNLEGIEWLEDLTNSDVVPLVK